MKFTKSVLLLALLGWSVTQAHADEYYNGVMSALKQDYKEAYGVLKPLAEKGDPRAIFNLGLMYHAGLFVAYDEKKAVELYQEAAKLGVPEAQQFLAAGYREGWFGLPMDYEKYKYWMGQSGGL